MSVVCCVTECGSEVNLKVRSALPDITVYLGDKLDRLSSFHGLVIIYLHGLSHVRI